MIYYYYYYYYYYLFYSFTIYDHLKRCRCSDVSINNIYKCFDIIVYLRDIIITHKKHGKPLKVFGVFYLSLSTVFYEIINC